MFEVMHSPNWFYGTDSLIDILSAVILLLLATASYHYYRLNSQQKNYLHLALSFALLAAAFGAKAIAYWFIPKVIISQQFGVVLVTAERLQASPRFYALFLGYRFLLVFALYWLYAIYQSPSRMNLLLITYLLFISTFFTVASYFVFHVTAFVLSFLIMTTYFYSYKKKAVRTTLYVAISFALFCLSRLLFIFVGGTHILYVLAELIQLAAFLCLLCTFASILYHAKKAITY
jgi:hypothetical protein